MAQLCDVPIFNWILKLIINLLERGRSWPSRREWEFCHCLQQRRISPSILLFSLILYNNRRAAWHMETILPVSSACRCQQWGRRGFSPFSIPTLPPDTHLGKRAFISSVGETRAAIRKQFVFHPHVQRHRGLSLCALLCFWVAAGGQGI